MHVISLFVEDQYIEDRSALLDKIDQAVSSDQYFSLYL